MTGPCDLTVIVLARDEERHIGRCIESVRGFARRVLVVDSGSTDRTRAIAAELGADVLENPFTTHGRQLNWALAHGGISTAWVMKLDADEYAMPGLADALRARMPGMDADVAGITLNLRRIFMGRWLRHGGLYPVQLLRIWRAGRGRCEERWMDEHVVVDGRVEHLAADFADHNLQSLTWWTAKHNGYASREALDALLHKGAARRAATGSGRQAAAKRWMKERVYSRMPPGLRAFLYFVYRYFLRLGFLDGWEGFVFHVLQGGWYRMLVDAKIVEMERAMGDGGLTLDRAARDVLGIDLARQACEADVEDIDHHRGAQPARHDPAGP